jgi:hypothetical protein
MDGYRVRRSWLLYYTTYCYGVMATTYNFALLSATIAAMAFSLVTNLAALPTRITIPVFFLSIAADLIIIIVALTTLL